MADLELADLAFDSVLEAATLLGEVDAMGDYSPVAAPTIASQLRTVRRWLDDLAREMMAERSAAIVRQLADAGMMAPWEPLDSDV